MKPSKRKTNRSKRQAKPLINRIGAWRFGALIPCRSWWKINPKAPKNHLHANTYHRKREAKAMEAEIAKSIDETFLMSKKEIFIIKSESFNNYKERSSL